MQHIPSVVIVAVGQDDPGLGVVLLEAVRVQKAVSCRVEVVHVQVHYWTGLGRLQLTTISS